MRSCLFISTSFVRATHVGADVLRMCQSMVAALNDHGQAHEFAKFSAWFGSRVKIANGIPGVVEGKQKTWLSSTYCPCIFSEAKLDERVAWFVDELDSPYAAHIRIRTRSCTRLQSRDCACTGIRGVVSWTTRS